MALERENAVAALRELIGATDPKKAAVGTIRQNFAIDVGKNSVHASDSVENAASRNQIPLRLVRNHRNSGTRNTVSLNRQ